MRDFEHNIDIIPFQSTRTITLLRKPYTSMIICLQSNKGNTEQVGQLLDNLLQGSTDTLDKFIDALRASGHSESLINELLRDPVKPESHLSAGAGELSERN